MAIGPYGLAAASGTPKALPLPIATGSGYHPVGSKAARITHTPLEHV